MFKQNRLLVNVDDTHENNHSPITTGAGQAANRLRQEGRRKQEPNDQESSTAAHRLRSHKTKLRGGEGNGKIQILH